MPEKQRPGWGLAAELPENFGMAWGARAILQHNGNLDFLYDRQQVVGPAKARDAFSDALNEKYVPLLTKKVRELFRVGKISASSEALVEIVNDGSVTIKANPNGSCGYLYVIAYTVDDTNGIWSGGVGSKPPEIGATVSSRLGEGVVIGRGPFHGYVGLSLILSDPPEWFVGQNGVHCPAVLFGAELG